MYRGNHASRTCSSSAKRGSGSYLMIDEWTSWNSGSLFSLVFVKGFVSSCSFFPAYIFITKLANLQSSSSNYDHGLVITPIKVLPWSKPYRAGCLLHRRFANDGIKTLNNSSLLYIPYILLSFLFFFFPLLSLFFSMSRIDPPPLVFHECINLHFSSFNLNRSRYWPTRSECKSGRSLVFQIPCFSLPNDLLTLSGSLFLSASSNRGR